MGFIQTLIDWGVSLGIVLLILAAVIFFWRKLKDVAKGEMPKQQKKSKVIDTKTKDPLYVEVDSFGGKKE